MGILNRLIFGGTIQMIRNRCMIVLAAMLLSGCVSQAQIEIESADQFAQMRAQMPVSNSVTDKAYVRCVATLIIQQLEEPYASYDWDIEVFEDEAINAFAMPGGKIGVFTGIFKVATNQDELGAVLGHEVALDAVGPLVVEGFAPRSPHGRRKQPPGNDEQGVLRSHRLEFLEAGVGHHPGSSIAPLR